MSIATEHIDTNADIDTLEGKKLQHVFARSFVHRNHLAEMRIAFRAFGMNFLMRSSHDWSLVIKRIIHTIQNKKNHNTIIWANPKSKFNKRQSNVESVIYSKHLRAIMKH